VDDEGLSRAAAVPTPGASTATIEADTPYRVRVAELPDEERPRERLERLGPQALRLDELLAILLRTGTAREDVLGVAQALVHDLGGLRGIAAADVPTLSNAHGMGPAKATTIVAAFELGRRLSMEPGAERPQVTTPEHVAALLQEQEELHVLVLDTKNRVLAAPMAYKGTVNASPARIAEIFRDAVRRNGTKIAIAHNHPSGDPTPSADDIDLTRSVIEAGELLDIELLDHLVFGHGRGRWVSMRRQRLGFNSA
jgi:DNA repair protein RadC